MYYLYQSPHLPDTSDRSNILARLPSNRLLHTKAHPPTARLTSRADDNLHATLTHPSSLHHPLKHLRHHGNGHAHRGGRGLLRGALRLRDADDDEATGDNRRYEDQQPDREVKTREVGGVGLGGEIVVAVLRATSQAQKHFARPRTQGKSSSPQATH